jgi:flavin-dependent dehydrogenase
MVLDRARFDQFLLERALDSGAKLHLGERFLGYKKEGKKYLVRTSKGNYESDLLVGADGPKSSVARAAGIYGNREFVFGYQARCRYKNLELGVTEIHLNKGEFSWIVPEDDKVARVGVIGPLSLGLKKDYKALLGSSKILEDQSGIIPLYNPKQVLKKKGEDVFLIGDAATQVKATTYGGIIYGLLAGKMLAEDKDSYERNFNKKLGKDLWISLKMREYMNKMSDEQATELVNIFQKKENKSILEKYDRDFPSKFIVQLLMKEAKLWKVGFDLFRKRGLK